MGPTQEHGLLADAGAGLVEGDEVVAAPANHELPLEEDVEVVGGLSLHDEHLAGSEGPVGKVGRQVDQLLHAATVLRRPPTSGGSEVMLV